MRKTLYLLLIATLAASFSWGQDTTYQTERLKITSLTPQTFVHTSYLEVPDYGRVPCNGLVFVNGGEAVIMDTPVDDSASVELIRWLEGQSVRIKAVVVTHFHDDCLAGLDAFHAQQIPSYARDTTVALARAEGNKLPTHGFDSLVVLDVGRAPVINRFLGEGHTVDNIVSYVPSERVLFGGCLIKEAGAGKGNLADANVDEWSSTVRRVQRTYPDVKYVVPGHGAAGGVELLEYTVEMFTVK